LALVLAVAVLWAGAGSALFASPAAPVESMALVMLIGSNNSQSWRAFTGYVSAASRVPNPRKQCHLRMAMSHATACVPLM
jgi:hypothetical protein